MATKQAKVDTTTNVIGNMNADTILLFLHREDMPWGRGVDTTARCALSNLLNEMVSVYYEYCEDKRRDSSDRMSKQETLNFLRRLQDQAGRLYVCEVDINRAED